jgi:hypothetical protein
MKSNAAPKKMKTSSFISSFLIGQVEKNRLLILRPVLFPATPN